MDRTTQGYKYIAHTLKEYGVSHIFFVEAMLRMSIKEMEELGVKGIMAHSENAAGYMADGYARVSGRPGICAAQSIGSANLAGGIMDAWLANSPVIALTGKKTAPYQYRNAYQEADHRLLYEGITKFNAEVAQPEQLPFLIRQCFRSAVTGRPRPVHLDIPNHTGRAIEVAAISEPLFIEEAYTKYPAFKPAAEEEKVIEAARAINESNKPVLVVGRGAIISGAEKEIYDLAVKGDIPVTTSPDGKTIIDENDSLWAGIAGSYGMDCANQTIHDADLVIYVGTAVGDQITHDWKIPKLDTKVVQIDIDGAELGRNYPNTIGLLGDAKVVVAQLLEKVNKVNRAEWRQEAAENLRKTMEAYEPYMKSDAVPIRPERLCVEVSKALPDDAVLVSDTGFSAVWTSIALKMRPTQKYLRAAGSLGWAFPGALGAKCGAPERPVICLIGDGGFFYHMSEMETAARYGINTVTIINNNQVMAQCLIDLNQVHKDKADKGTSRVQFINVNFSKIAENMGCLGIRVERAEDIGPAIKKALDANRPAIVEVMTDGTATVPPSFIAGR